MNRFAALLVGLSLGSVASSALAADGAAPTTQPATRPAAYHLADLPLKLPAGVKLGAVSAVATDSRGDLFVFHRAEPPILVFHPDGTFVR
ncbi:MAG TPA: hypothetical protein VF796_27700, partial [Humisphaera sp.]